MAENVVAEERALEHSRRFAQAIVDGDIGVLEELLAADFTYTHKNGWVEPREELIERVRGGRRSTRMDFEDTRVRSYRGTAIVNGTARMKVGPSDGLLEFDSSFSCVWVESEDALRLVAYQSTEQTME